MTGNGFCWACGFPQSPLSAGHARDCDRFHEDLTGRGRDLVEWLREEERGNPGTDVSSGLLGLAADVIEKMRVEGLERMFRGGNRPTPDPHDFRS